MKELTGLLQKDLAVQVFGMSDKSLSNKITRKTVDLDIIIKWAGHNNVDLNWLFYGKGNKYLPKLTANDNSVARLHQSLILNFENPELAKSINEALLDIEKMNPDGLLKIYEHVNWYKEGMEDMKKKKNV